MRPDELSDLYHDTILDHYKNPRGLKTLDSCDLENQGYNPICGDKVVVKAKFEDDRIKDISVESQGCAISVASGSMMAELLPGKSIEEVRRISEAFREMMNGKDMPEDIDYGDLDALEGVRKFHVRIKCALLAWATLRELINAWQEKNAIEAPTSTETED